MADGRVDFVALAVNGDTINAERAERIAVETLAVATGVREG